MLGTEFTINFYAFPLNPVSGAAPSARVVRATVTVVVPLRISALCTSDRAGTVWIVITMLLLAMIVTIIWMMMGMPSCCTTKGDLHC